MTDRYDLARLPKTLNIAANGTVITSLGIATAGGANSLVIDSSGNVGVGTSSPGAKLDIISSGLQFRTAASTTSGYGFLQIGQSATASQNWHIGSEGDGTFRWYNGNWGAGTERMRIDSSGNLGIGASVNNVYDQIASARPLVVQGSSSSTTVAGSAAAITIVNSDTTTNNMSQLNFAAITGANTAQFTSATISCQFGARTNAQYSTGELVFATSSSLNSAPTEKARITAAGNFQFNSGYGSVATAYGCRAWVNFNGTGTVAIRSSGNITSITDNGVGNYTLNFTNTFPDANYIGAGMCKNNDDLNDTWVVQMQNTNTKTTSAFQFFVREGGSVNDSSEVHMMIVR